ncbi:hypothetical protein KIW84_031046 [Lathyrus oleraceus]|uniref:Transposase-associated domain-containing protein n=1 Tax=Pisum sativum TaxID=3888 RepID=A0A9D4XPQ9_PEA|nr:hypothetical protein KIW84_031046 [Pisum sativum]
MYDRTYPGRRGLKPNFEEGVKGFITWAFAQECCLSEGGVRCPCLKCECRPIISDPEEVERHLKRRGFIKNYWVWTYNGEQLPSNVQRTTTTHASSSRSHVFMENSCRVMMYYMCLLIVDKMPPRTDKGKGQQRPRIRVCEAPQSAVCPPPQSQVEPMSTTSQHFMPLQSSMGYPPPQTQVDPMTMGSQPFLSLLSSHGYPMAQLGNPSFISPSGNPSFISPSGNPSFISPSGTSSYHQTGGSSFPHPSQVPPPFMQSGIFPDPTQVPLSSQHPTNTPSSSTLSRSHTPPTTHMPSSSTHHGGSRTPHPPRATDIPVPEE